MNKKQKVNSKNFSHLSSGVLVLENKKIFKGIGIGYQGTATGEVCFNTSLTGYQEIISDPSYAGQIINFTFPHIGNVGTNQEDHESDKIWTKGVIFNTEITNPSNYRSLKHLDQWLQKNKIVGITGIDTRNLTNFIRDKGAPKGTISFYDKKKLNIKKLVKITTSFSSTAKRSFLLFCLYIEIDSLRCLIIFLINCFISSSSVSFFCGPALFRISKSLIDDRINL